MQIIRITSDPEPAFLLPITRDAAEQDGDENHLPDYRDSGRIWRKVYRIPLGAVAPGEILMVSAETQVDNNLSCGVEIQSWVLLSNNQNEETASQTGVVADISSGLGTNIVNGPTYPAGTPELLPYSDQELYKSVEHPYWAAFQHHWPITRVGTYLHPLDQVSIPNAFLYMLVYASSDSDLARPPRVQGKRQPGHKELKVRADYGRMDVVRIIP